VSRADIDRFRLRCRQFRWLAIFMVVCIRLNPEKVSRCTGKISAWRNGLF